MNPVAAQVRSIPQTPSAELTRPGRTLAWPAGCVRRSLFQSAMSVPRPGGGARLFHTGLAFVRAVPVRRCGGPISQYVAVMTALTERAEFRRVHKRDVPLGGPAKHRLYASLLPPAKCSESVGRRECRYPVPSTIDRTRLEESNCVTSVRLTNILSVPSSISCRSCLFKTSLAPQSSLFSEYVEAAAVGENLTVSNESGRAPP